MPKYPIYVNKGQDKILQEYGELLASQGLIERPVTKYKICKFILDQVIESCKKKFAVVNQQQIVDEKTHLEKEEILSDVVKSEEKEVEETELHKTYKGIR